MLGVLVGLIAFIFSRMKRRSDLKVQEWLRPVHNATPYAVSTAEVGTPHIITRRDGAVWAGPWKNDGHGFTRVPKNWWIFKTRQKAEQELESNDFLKHCTVEEVE